jgi:hypothetical protein
MRWPVPWRRTPPSPAPRGVGGGPLRNEMGLRVLFLDRPSRLRLGDGVSVVGPKWAMQPRRPRKYPPLVDVVVGQPASLDGPALRRLRATGHDAPVVVVDDEPTSSRQPGDPALRWSRPSVSPRTFNPSGRRASSAGDTIGYLRPTPEAAGAAGPRAGTAASATAIPDDLRHLLAGLPAPGRTPSGTGTGVVRVGTGVVALEDPWDGTSRTVQAEREAALEPIRAVVDHPGLHATPAHQARWLTRLTATGIPVVAELSEPAEELLGPRLVEAIRACHLAQLFDPHGWDAASVRQRTAALAEHGAAHAWRTIAQRLDVPAAPPPTVSVVLATNRPADLLDAAGRYAAFTYAPRELVVGLHGDDFPPGTDDRVRAIAGGEVTLRHVPSDRNLGMVLDELTADASGELVTKMDDDDLYAPTHLEDLVEAMRYSRATLVGKGSEFVYLAEIDTTIRRLVSGAESRSRSIGGGTLMIGRADLRTVGGWQRAPRAVDQRLMDDVVANGGRIHRTHGFGFVLMRQVDGHTWSSDVDYFLRQAAQQWPGLAREAAGV